jgi:hypothetical protein
MSHYYCCYYYHYHHFTSGFHKLVRIV